MDIEKYWECTIAQNKDEMKRFFNKCAYINWHNTNEHFTVDEYVKGS